MARIESIEAFAISKCTEHPMLALRSESKETELDCTGSISYCNSRARAIRDLEESQVFRLSRSRTSFDDVRCDRYRRAPHLRLQAESLRVGKASRYVSIDCDSAVDPPAQKPSKLRVISHRQPLLGRSSRSGLQPNSLQPKAYSRAALTAFPNAADPRRRLEKYYHRRCAARRRECARLHCASSRAMNSPSPVPPWLCPT